MKKILYITGLSVGAVLSSQAQTLIAGFDFDSFPDANYSDLGLGGSVNDGAAAAAFGTFSFQDGGTSNTFPAVQTGSGSLTANATLVSSVRVPGFNNTMDTSGNGWLQADDLGALSSADGGFFDFNISTGGTLYEDFTFSFAAAQSQGGTTQLNVEYSIDAGSSFIDLGDLSVSALESSGGESLSVDALGFSASDVIFRVNFTDIATGTRFDNVQVSGTVVPEPSAFAAIAGVLVLGFAATRRRRS